MRIDGGEGQAFLAALCIARDKLASTVVNRTIGNVLLSALIRAIINTHLVLYMYAGGLPVVMKGTAQSWWEEIKTNQEGTPLKDVRREQMKEVYFRCWEINS